ncbi:nuclear transport factor 2 family protein [Gloeocapsopsis crepidinum LEGE 06123]|uniref:Nuclear transport factor 2 family protein n=2 Tax=Gloeocapsopsis crepidinum TaxID=693223 RepID=A0ABR9UQC8_9CHRO|nr:nuclear transport factor 2 family protein [Gloeocapsopsis crepidinum LEGE 06123]
MRNFMFFLTPSRKLPQQNKLSASSWVALLLMTLTLSVQSHRVQAQATPDAPPALKNLLARVDAAANAHNANAVVQYYGTNFTHSDGLTQQSMAQSLNQLWQRYPQLRYTTRVESWKPEGRAIVAETITNISGSQVQDNRNLMFNATIRSRQRIENEKIVRQDILWERSQLRAGAKPPTIEVRLPQQVKAGQQFNFDAIVQEPLGDDYLLGAVIEEPVQSGNYLNPVPIELELLPAGGIFKQGRAPAAGNHRWISAIVVRGDGMTMVTQRLQVVGANAASTTQSATTTQQQN